MLHNKGATPMEQPLWIDFVDILSEPDAQWEEYVSRCIDVTTSKEFRLIFTGVELSVESELAANNFDQSISIDFGHY